MQRRLRFNLILAWLFLDAQLLKSHGWLMRMFMATDHMRCAPWRRTVWVSWCSWSSPSHSVCVLLLLFFPFGFFLGPNENKDVNPRRLKRRPLSSPVWVFRTPLSHYVLFFSSSALSVACFEFDPGWCHFLFSSLRPLSPLWHKTHLSQRWQPNSSLEFLIFRASWSLCCTVELLFQWGPTG